MKKQEKFDMKEAILNDIITIIKEGLVYLNQYLLGRI